MFQGLPTLTSFKIFVAQLLPATFTTSFNVKIYIFDSHLVFTCLVFIAVQQELIAYTTLIHCFRNQNKKCLLRGTSLIFTYNSG